MVALRHKNARIYVDLKDVVKQIFALTISAAKDLKYRCLLIPNVGERNITVPKVPERCRRTLCVSRSVWGFAQHSWQFQNKILPSKEFWELQKCFVFAKDPPAPFYRF
jgi:hypothetical protein